MKLKENQFKKRDDKIENFFNNINKQTRECFSKELFREKNILITGGSRGIGKALVFCFHALGAANIYFTFKNSRESSFELSKYLNDKKPEQKIFPIQINYENPEETKKINTQIETFGDIDILINNVGLTNPKPFLITEENDFKIAFDVNLYSATRTISSFLPKMLKRKNGVIINISSIASKYGLRGQTIYSATKGALDSLTRSLASEIGGRGVRVNSIAPGLIDTDLSDENVKNSDKENLIRGSMLGIPGTTIDVALTAVFLASPAARFITGQVITVDGGLSKNLAFFLTKNK